MKFNNSLVLLLAFTMALSGIYCKKSESPTESSISDFVGTWQAGSATSGSLMKYTNKSNPAIVFDMFLFGSTIDIVIKSDKSYTLRLVVPPLEIDQVEEGKILIVGDQITLTANNYPDEAVTFKYSMNGDQLSLVDNNAEFDFNFDDVDEPAILNIIMKKM